MKQINLRLPEDVLVRVDAARGSVPRERWIRDLIGFHLVLLEGDPRPDLYPPGSSLLGVATPMVVGDPPRLDGAARWAATAHPSELLAMDDPVDVEDWRGVVPHAELSGVIRPVEVVADPPVVPPSLPVKRPRKKVSEKRVVRPSVDVPKPSGYVRNTPVAPKGLGEPLTHVAKQGPRAGRCECGQPMFAPVHS